MIPLPPPPPPPPPAAPKKRGRPFGSRNQATLLREAAARAALEGITPDGGPASASALALLQTLYKDARLPLDTRMRAAALAAPLEVARPVPVPPPKENVPLAQALDAAFARTGRARLATPQQRTLSPEDEAALSEMLGLAP